VDDIDEAVDELTARGVRFERYDGFEQDEKGIFRDCSGQPAGSPRLASCRTQVFPSGSLKSAKEL
jgi:hypothetical protein